MAGKYRRLYLGTGATLITLFVALQLYGLQIIDVSGDIYCTDTCTSYFDVRNPTYRSIYIYNKESIKLDFSPQIKDYDLYIKYYGKWRKIDFTMATRLPNVPKDRKYVFVFPRYSTKHFKLVGKKEDWKDVKWTFGMPGSELDPLWESGVQVGDKIVKELCVPLYRNWTEKVYHYKTCKGTSYPNGTIVEDYKCLDDVEEIPRYDQVDCRKTGKVNVSGNIIQEEDRWCKLEEDEICCMSNIDGGRYGAWYRTDGSVDNPCRKVEDI